jgi:dUTP pyrophosphatase
MQVKFKRLREGVKLPERGHAIDVGLDVFVPEGGILSPGPNKIPLGFSMEVPVGYCASIWPRTGMASGDKVKDMRITNYDGSVFKRLIDTGDENDPFRCIADDNCTVKDIYKHNVALLAQIPPIDPGYTGEVHAIVINTGSNCIKYPAGARFGQLVFFPIVYAIPVEDIDTSRGNKGFGSTGL